MVRLGCEGRRDGFRVGHFNIGPRIPECGMEFADGGELGPTPVIIMLGLQLGDAVLEVPDIFDGRLGQ